MLINVRNTLSLGCLWNNQKMNITPQAAQAKFVWD